MDSNPTTKDPGKWDRIDIFWPYCVLIAVNIYILGPIGILLIARYYKKRKIRMYDTRRPELVTILNCASVFIIMIYLPLHILCFEILWKNNGEWQEWYVQRLYCCFFERSTLHLFCSQVRNRVVLDNAAPLLRTDAVADIFELF